MLSTIIIYIYAIIHTFLRLSYLDFLHNSILDLELQELKRNRNQLEEKELKVNERLNQQDAYLNDIKIKLDSVSEPSLIQRIRLKKQLI